MLDLVDLVSLAAIGATLAYASVQDLKTREVPNKLWTLLYPVGLTVLVLHIVWLPEAWVFLLSSAGIIAAVSLVTFYAGFFGGADAKAFILLGLLMPSFPTFATPLFGVIHPFLPMVVLVNSFLISSFSAFVLLAGNVAKRATLFQGFEKESFARKLSAMFSGFKTSFENLEGQPFLYPMEAPDQSEPSQRRFQLLSKVEEDREMLVARLRPLKEQGLLNNGVWVTPALPHLVFVMIAFLLTLALGDIALWGMLNLVLFVSGF